MTTALSEVDTQAQEAAIRYRAKPRLIKARAAELGLERISARALADYTGLNRKTMDRVLSGGTVSKRTADKILHWLGREGEPLAALFDAVLPTPEGGLGRLADRPASGGD